MDALAEQTSPPFRILLLEDSKADAVLIRHHLKLANIQATYAHATNEAEFLDLLSQGEYDLVLADYYLRGFDALSALETLQTRKVDVPVILVSGQIGEEVAVKSLQAGATDYLLKDKLGRLGPAVKRAMEEHRQQQHNRAIEAQMHRQAEILRKGEQVAQFGAFEIDPTSKTVFWTLGIYAIFEIDPTAFTPQYEDLDHLLSGNPNIYAFLAEVLQTKETRSFSSVQEIITPDGRTKYCRFSGDIVLENGDPKIIGIGQNITKEYEAELALRKINDELEERVEARTYALKESEEKYRLITENMLDMVTLQDAEGKFTFASSSIRQLLGYEPDDILGKDPVYFIHPEDLPKLASQHMQLQEIKQPQTVRFQHRSGEYIWLETLTTGIYHEEGVLMGLQTISRDISERKKTEEQMRKALERERELNELRSNFVSIASHQFRTPLAVIRSNIQLLDMISRQRVPEGKKALFDRSIERVEGEISRLLELMDDILILGKHDMGQMSNRPKMLHIEDLVHNLIQSEFMPAPDGRRIRMGQTAQTPAVYADPRLLEHAFSNLLTNALKYSPGKPDPEVTIEQKQDHIRVKIRDYGVGIPADEIPHLFESFFRGKNVQHIKGTGLGLSIADQFVKMSQGSIEATSIPGKFTDFVVVLPLAESLTPQT